MRNRQFNSNMVPVKSGLCDANIAEKDRMIFGAKKKILKWLAIEYDFKTVTPENLLTLV